MSQILEMQGARSRPVEEILGPIREKIDQAKRDRARLEPTWHSNRAFAAGKHWLKWSRTDRRLVLDPKDVERGQERYTADLLTERLKTAEGQLGGVDERPQLQFRRDDIPSEDFTKAANDGLAYGWEVEWRAAEILTQIKRKLLVDGTAAVRCRFDPTVGPLLGDLPFRNGQPILDQAEARSYVSETAARGERAELKHVHEGRIVWEPLSVFQLLVPPGLENPEDFPWQAIIRPVPVDKLVAEFGEQAKGIESEPLAVMDLLGVKEALGYGIGGQEDGQPGKLTDHCALVTYYEQPSSEYPKGRVVNFAQDRMLGAQRTELPYKTPRGDYASGIVYFRYWPVEGRFFGRALIEAAKGIQRMYDRRCQQEHEIIDRNMPYLLVAEGQDSEREGLVMEKVYYRSGGAPPPQPQQGVDVSNSLWRSKEGLREDLADAMGVGPVSLGENPDNVQTYAQLQLLAEKERTRTDPIIEDFQSGVSRLTELSVLDMRRYWSADKVMALAGDEDMAEAVEFQANQLPEFFLLKVAEGTKARTVGAEVQLIFDLFNQAKMVAQPLPLQWLKDSLDAGKALPLPDLPANVHLEKARWENAQLSEGKRVVPAYYDLPDVHIPAHREAMVEAEMAGRMDLVAGIEEHIQATLALAQQTAQLTASFGPPSPQTPLPVSPNGPAPAQALPT